MEDVCKLVFMGGDGGAWWWHGGGVDGGASWWCSVVTWRWVLFTFED